jgi:hypothetical protein
MKETNGQAKYIAVNIPVPLMRRIGKLVTAQGCFMSATDYVTYVLRVISSRRPEDNDSELFSSVDLDEIRARLEALGSLSSPEKISYPIEDCRELNKPSITVLPPIKPKAGHLVLASNQKRTRSSLRKIG